MSSLRLVTGNHIRIDSATLQARATTGFPAISHPRPRYPVSLNLSVVSHAHIDSWLARELARSDLRTKQIQPGESAQWHFDADGCLAHRSGRFFRVVGVEYASPLEESRVTQPIIEQPEIGILCFLVARDEQGWWVLAQAKVEPGNVGGAQLAPTVQATQSNYQCVHGGKPVPYLQEASDGGKVLYDQLQSEQNSRFLHKLNRNKVVQVDRDNLTIDDRFLWLPVKRLLSLLGQSHRVNSDARSVLACWLLSEPAQLRDCLPRPGRFGHILSTSIDAHDSLHDDATLQRWLTELNQRWSNPCRLLPLADLDVDWFWQDGVLVSRTGNVLQVRHLEVWCDTREVTHWDQPILACRARARLVTLVGEIDGVLHLLLQARLEAGNRLGFELTTTVQADDAAVLSEQERAIAERIPSDGRLLIELENSEEGGRFDHCVNGYEIYWVDDVQKFSEGPFHRWVSLRQVADGLRQQNRLTNELRSALSALLAVDV